MELKQLSGDTGEVQKKLKGKERIFSRKDTKTLFRLSASANNEKRLKSLGKAVYDMIKKQDKTPPKYV
jgi:hypothetical protein